MLCVKLLTCSLWVYTQFLFCVKFQIMYLCRWTLMGMSALLSTVATHTTFLWQLFPEIWRASSRPCNPSSRETTGYIVSVSQQEAASRPQGQRGQPGPGSLAEVKGQTRVAEQAWLGSWDCVTVILRAELLRARSRSANWNEEQTRGLWDNHAEEGAVTKGLLKSTQVPMGLAKV